MTAFFIVDAPRPAFFEWLPLLRGVHPEGYGTIVAVDPNLFAAARWALPSAQLRPLSDALRGPTPPTADLRALFQSFDDRMLEPICVLDGTGSYVFDHVRAHLVDAFRMHILLADADGRSPVRYPAPSAVPARGSIDLGVIGERLGMPLRLGPTAAKRDGRDDPREKRRLLTCVLAFGPHAFVTQSGRAVIADLKRAIDQSGHRIVNVMLADLTHPLPPSYLQEYEVTPRLVTEFELLHLLSESACLFTNDPAASHLCAAAQRPMMVFSAGLAWYNHIPLSNMARIFGTDFALGHARDAFIAEVAPEKIYAATRDLLEGTSYSQPPEVVSPSARDGLDIIAYLSDSQSPSFRSPLAHGTTMASVPDVTALLASRIHLLD